MTRVSPGTRFIPETILPDQFAAIWHRHIPTPEVALLHALLEQALRDLRLTGHPRRALKRLSREAYKWVASADRSHPFSFVNVCDTLGLSANAVRMHFLSDSNLSDGPAPAMVTPERCHPGNGADA